MDIEEEWFGGCHEQRGLLCGLVEEGQSGALDLYFTGEARTRRCDNKGQSAVKRRQQ